MFYSASWYYNQQYNQYLLRLISSDTILTVKVGTLPIQFVPEVAHIPDQKSGKSLTVKFKILHTFKKTYRVIVEGGTEAFINHIKVHKKKVYRFVLCYHRSPNLGNKLSYRKIDNRLGPKVPSFLD